MQACDNLEQNDYYNKVSILIFKFLQNIYAQSWKLNK